MEKIILFGTGQNAALARSVFSQDGSYQVAAFTVDRDYLTEERFLDLPVIPFEEIQAYYPPEEFAMFISISFRKVNRLRAEKYAQAKAKGYTLVSQVSSRANLPAGFQTGDNCLVGACNIGPFVEVGSNVIIASGCVIGHHTVVKDHCYLGPGAVVSGSVTVEPYCFIGSGAVIRDRLTIKEATVIGAGSVILEDTVERGVYLAKTADRLPISSEQLPLG
jgi:sugar O-acyltransferase (sialic acid O-acetyltransferase NeuD family)